MYLDSFIGWIGGKKLLRNKIIAEFPSENLPLTYVEVFGGAGWVFFAKEKNLKQLEVFNDFDSDLINLYRCIKYHREALEQELGLMFQSHELFFDIKEQLKCRGLTDIQRAARYFYLIKMSFSNSRRTFATKGKRMDKTIERFEEIQSRLVSVVVEHRDFEHLIKLYDSESTLFYLDPPYHGTERYYEGNFKLEDHYRLRKCLGEIKGKFVLSYNDDDFIRGLYSDFITIEVERANSLSIKEGAKFNELIIKNY